MLFHCRFSTTVSVVVHTVTEFHLPGLIEAQWFKLSKFCAYVNVKNSRTTGWCCCTKQLPRMSEQIAMNLCTGSQIFI